VQLGHVVTGLAVGLAVAAAGAIVEATHTAAVWALLGLWVLCTIAGVTYVLVRSRAERRPPSVRILLGEAGPPGRRR
jgi:hypothetical protein